MSARSYLNWRVGNLRIRLALRRMRDGRPLRRKGFLLHLDPDDRIITPSVVLEGWWAEAEVRQLLRHLRPGDTVVDIGANQGLHALRFAHSVGPEGFVLAFEPEPSNFALLQRNVQANGLRNVQAEPVALWSGPGRLALHLSHSNKGGHSVGRGGVKDPEGQVQVKALPLDDYLNTCLAQRTVRFIKMDVQGAEARVLEGARRLLERDRPILMAEYCPFMIAQAGGSAPRLVSLLVELGYRLYAMDGERAEEIDPEDLKVQKPEAEVNLLALPRAAPAIHEQGDVAPHAKGRASALKPGQWGLSGSSE